MIFLKPKLQPILFFKVKHLLEYKFYEKNFTKINLRKKLDKNCFAIKAISLTRKTKKELPCEQFFFIGKNLITQIIL